MFTLATALLGCGSGFLIWYPRAGRPWQRLLGVLAMHLCFVGAGTLGIELLASHFGDLVSCSAIGAWFALLFGIHAGHALAIRYWGTPLNRPVVSFVFRNLLQLARAFPREVFCSMGAFAFAVVIGMMVARGDVAANMFAAWPFALVMKISPVAAMACGAASLVGVAWGARGGRLWRDPLLRLFADANRTDFGLSRGDKRGRELEVQLGIGIAPKGNSWMPAIESQVAPSAHRADPVVSVGRRANVVLFIVDSLRAQHLSFHGYGRATTPYLASCIAERGARAVRLAVANCASSECGSWSLLTSRRYRHIGLHSLSLHRLLRQAGYKVRFFLSGIHRGWMGMESLYGADHDFFLDGVGDTKIISEIANVPEQEPSESDFFCFHLMSAHCSGALMPRFRKWRPSNNRLVYSSRACPDARMRDGIVNHYDNSILQTDDYIREICSQLERKGYLRDAIVIVTADHGESLADRSGEFGIIGHAKSLFQESIHIPFFVMDTRGGLPDTGILADQTDIAPTIADLLGTEAPSSWQGQSIFRTPFRQSTHVEFVTHPGALPHDRRRAMEAIISVRPSGIYKLLRHRESGQETYHAAFCLSTDPAEQHPLADDALLAELNALRRTFVGSASVNEMRPRLDVDAESRRAA